MEMEMVQQVKERESKKKSHRSIRIDEIMTTARIHNHKEMGKSVDTEGYITVMYKSYQVGVDAIATVKTLLIEEAMELGDKLKSALVVNNHNKIAKYQKALAVNEEEITKYDEKGRTVINWKERFDKSSTDPQRLSRLDAFFLKKKTKEAAGKLAAAALAGEGSMTRAGERKAEQDAAAGVVVVVGPMTRGRKRKAEAAVAAEDS